MPDLARLRKELSDLRELKRLSFDDLDKVIRRVYESYPHLFPKFRVKEKNVSVVYFFGAGCFPISLEREHKGRDCVLPRFAKLALNQIEELLTYIEGQQ